MSLTPLLTGLFVIAALCALAALAQAAGAHRCWRRRRRFAAAHRLLWSLVFLLLAALGGLGGGALLGWHRLSAETPLAELEARRLAPQHYVVTIRTPDGASRQVELAGEEWQLDARVIKWDSRAVMLGAPALYRLDRISGRWRDVEQERATPKSVIALAPSAALDLWQLKRRFPRWLAWIDADYGSAAYLPLVDDGRYTVTLAAAGGLVARPADEATRQQLEAAEWSQR